MTLASPIFRKLLFSAFLLILTSLLVMDFYLSRYIARQQVETVERRLAGDARILAGELRTSGNIPPSDWVRGAGARAKARVTLIDPRGVVLGDSQHDPETMENHANRPEIREAYQGRVGASIRHSHTLDRDLCYVALPITYGGKPDYVLRLAVPLEDLDAAIAAVRTKVFAASLVAAMLALVIAYFFSRSFTQRISRLRRFAESLADHPASRALPVDGEDELGALAQSLNQMAARLHALVENLALESARREAVLSGMVEGVLAVDGDLRVTFCNDTFAHAVGVQGHIPQRLPVLELVRDPALLEMLNHVLASGETVKKRIPLSAAEGRVFEAQATPLVAPSHRGAIVLLHDITDFERLERVRKDFVANVSHELRTPLTAIRGYVETLLEGALEDRDNNRRFLEIIQSHTVRLNNIASDLLTLSALETGASTTPMERISARAALQAAMSAVEAEARVRGVKLVCGKLGDIEVMGDMARLEQALVNLLDNAVKFNRPGGEVRAEIDLAPDGKARIAIADTGVGIPSEALGRIFERFYRVDAARSREVGGTGLGLSIVKHVIERMNGTISVESQLGKGSTFVISLPSAV